MPTRQRIQLSLVCTLPVLLAGWFAACDKPDDIAKFCSMAIYTLKHGDAIFDDMQASCVRETESREEIGSFQAGAPNPAACATIGKQAEGLKAASKILCDYFDALHDLAKFGSSKAGDDANDLLAKAAGLGGMKAGPQAALGHVTGLLVRVATSGYQRKHLAEDIVQVHGDVRVALEGLGEIARVAYTQQLQDEEKKTAARYKEFLQEHAKSAESAGIILTLDSRWQRDRADLAIRRSAARCYAAALDLLAKGHDDLADHAHGLGSKTMSGLLSSSVEQLQNLCPAWQRAFLGE